MAERHAADLIFTGDPTTFDTGIPNRDMTADEVRAHPRTLAEILAAGRHRLKDKDAVPEAALKEPKPKAPDKP